MQVINFLIILNSIYLITKSKSRFIAYFPLYDITGYPFPVLEKRILILIKV
jgi:hypothetical protein